MKHMVAYHTCSLFKKFRKERNGDSRIMFWGTYIYPDCLGN
jgi:hypothetical protein